MKRILRIILILAIALAVGFAVGASAADKTYPQNSFVSDETV